MKRETHRQPTCLASVSCSAKSLFIPLIRPVSSLLSFCHIKIHWEKMFLSSFTLCLIIYTIPKTKQIRGQHYNHALLLSWINPFGSFLIRSIKVNLTEEEQTFDKNSKNYPHDHWMNCCSFCAGTGPYCRFQLFSTEILTTISPLEVSQFGTSACYLERRTWTATKKKAIVENFLWTVAFLRPAHWH